MVDAGVTSDMIATRHYHPIVAQPPCNVIIAIVSPQPEGPNHVPQENVTMSILARIVLVAILLCLAATVAQAAKKTGAPRALQTEFDGFIGKFRAALKANDSAAIASMTKLPFMEDETYSDAAQFRAKAYPEFFTRKNRACIRREKAVYDRDEENNDNYHISCYENIFTFTRTKAGFLFTDVSVND